MTSDVYFAARAGARRCCSSASTLKFARTRASRDARRLFFGSIIYLPMLWILMIAGRPRVSLSPISRRSTPP